MNRSIISSAATIVAAVSLSATGALAQTTLNIASTMRTDLRISENLNNISVSITALFSGIFIVVAGNLADRIGVDDLRRKPEA